MFLSMIRSNPRGWLIVAVIFFTVSFSFAARMSLPVLIPVWEAEFKWSRTFLTSGAALIMIVMGGVAPYAGHLLDKFGARYLVSGGTILSGCCVILGALMDSSSLLLSPVWVFIGVYCMLSAVGYGMVSLPVATATITREFEENRGLATSIGTSGVGGGQLLFIPLMAWAIELAGWRPTLILFGILIIVMGVLAFCLLPGEPIPRDAKKQAGDGSKSFMAKFAILIRSPVFWLLGGAYFICGFTTAGIVKIHLIPYAVACGFTITTGAAATGVLAGFDMVGMVISGYLTDKLHRPGLLGSVYFLRALSFIMLFFITDNYVLLFMFAILFGTLDFATVPPTAGLIASHLGVSTMGFNMGILFLGHSLGGALGAVAGGALFDLFQTYDWTWMAGLALALIAAVLAWSVPEKRENTPAVTEPVAA
ncbi:MAG: MFS transporter [Alphaproteobacteria bacterium]